MSSTQNKPASEERLQLVVKCGHALSVRPTCRRVEDEGVKKTRIDVLVTRCDENGKLKTSGKPMFWADAVRDGWPSVWELREAVMDMLGDAVDFWAEEERKEARRLGRF